MYARRKFDLFSKICIMTRKTEITCILLREKLQHLFQHFTGRCRNIINTKMYNLQLGINFWKHYFEIIHVKYIKNTCKITKLYEKYIGMTVRYKIYKYITYLNWLF